MMCPMVKILLSSKLYFRKPGPQMTFQFKSVPKAQCRGHLQAHLLLNVCEDSVETDRARSPKES